nr:hypothetical transcript [Hymenolepis microstoma]
MSVSCPGYTTGRIPPISNSENVRDQVEPLLRELNTFAQNFTTSRCQVGGEKLSRKVEMESFISPTVLSRCCSVSFSPHSPRSIAHGLAHQHFSSYEEVKIGLVDSWILSKDENFFPRRDSPVEREMSQCGTQRWIIP